MKKETFFRCYFNLMGLYDVLLGLGFILFYRAIYGHFNIVLPNHPSYIYIPAFFLLSAGIGEFLIAKNLLRNADLALVRLLMKASFAGVVFLCYFTCGIPTIYLFISGASIMGVIINAFYIAWVSKVKVVA